MENFEEIKVYNTPILDVVDMCLVLGLIKFKLLDFDKYKGVNYPQTHL